MSELPAEWLVSTFIATANDKAPVAQRGKAKQKRSDLRLVGLGLVVTRDGGIPLTWHAYPGDRPDVTQFPAMIDQLLARYQAVTAAASVPAAAADMTVVFDAGQNSGDNFAHLAGTGLHYIGSVPASDCPDLTALPASVRSVADKDRFGGLTAYDTRREAYGAARRAILTHSTRKPWVRRVITWQLTGDQPKDLRLSWSADPDARAALEEEIFGKHVLITSHEDWPVKVIAGYRSQSEAEAEFSFRQMKDPHVASFSPMRHWTEHNIPVHVFTCVLACRSPTLCAAPPPRPAFAYPSASCCPTSPASARPSLSTPPRADGPKHAHDHRTHRRPARTLRNLRTRT